MKNSRHFFTGLGYKAYFAEGSNSDEMHPQMTEILKSVVLEIRAIQKAARTGGSESARVWPMIVLRSPKGWTGPKDIDGRKIEGTFRSHQVPMEQFRSKPDHLRILEEWMRSYRPEELFERNGSPVAEVIESAAATEIGMAEVAAKPMKRSYSIPSVHPRCATWCCAPEYAHTACISPSPRAGRSPSRYMYLASDPRFCGMLHSF